MKIWRDAALIDSSEIAFEEDYWPDGSGFFETIRTEGGQVVELGRHMRRAISASERLGIRLPTEGVVRRAISQLLIEEVEPLGRLRLLFSTGRFIAVHLPYKEIIEPLKLAVSKNPTDSPSVVLKQFPYTRQLSDLEEARKSGFDEVLQFNMKEFFTEGAVSNFLFRIAGDWMTTPLSAGVLPGVMRAIAIERCLVSVAPLHREEMYRIESAIALSSLKLSHPVASIGERTLEMDQNMKALIASIREKTQLGSVG